MEPRGTRTLKGLQWGASYIELIKLFSARKMSSNPLKSRTTNTKVLQLSKKDLMMSVDCIE